MNIIVILFFLNGLLFFETSLTIFRYQSDRKLNILASVLSMVLSVFSFGFVFFLLVPSKSDALIMSKITLIESCFVGVLAFHFMFELSRINSIFNKNLLQVFFYLIPVFLAIYSLFYPLIIDDVFHTAYGWDNHIKIHFSFFDYLYCLYSLGSFLLGFTLILYKIRISTEKKVIRYLVNFLKMNIFGALAVILAIIFFFLSNKKSGEDFYTFLSDFLVAVVLLVWLVSLRIMMTRYQFLRITPELSTDNLIAGINTPVLVIDQFNYILLINTEAEKLFGQNGLQPDYKGLSFKDLLQSNKSRDEFFKNIEKREKTNTFLYNFSSEEYHCSSTYTVTVLPIKNRISQIIGSIIFFYPFENYKKFQEFYSLTEREIEIVKLLDTGLSSAEIAQFLYLSELTVKTHIHNIYQKTGIKKRVELIKLIRSYL